VAHPPDCWGPSEPDRRTEQWRAARIEHFKERQWKTREWINFEEIADWCSREDGSIVPDENKRAAALDLLATDLLAGKFEENGRSRVLFLDPAIPRGWRAREWFKSAFDLRSDYRRYYLAACWIPRRLFKRWLARYHLPESPLRFEPVSGQSRPVSFKKPKRGRPAEYNWDGVKSKLTAYVSQNGPVQTLHELLQKCADFANELHRKNKTPNDKTIREAIKKYQLDIAAGVGPRK
jgi:hypothetical protein